MNMIDMKCEHCESNPCHGLFYRDILESHGEFLNDGSQTPNFLRRQLYAIYVREVHGFLGRGIRVEIPVCVRNMIREIYPDPQGQYMGHRDK